MLFTMLWDGRGIGLGALLRNVRWRWSRRRRRRRKKDREGDAPAAIAEQGLQPETKILRRIHSNLRLFFRKHTGQGLVSCHLNWSAGGPRCACGVVAKSALASNLLRYFVLFCTLLSVSCTLRRAGISLLAKEYTSTGYTFGICRLNG